MDAQDWSAVIVAICSIVAATVAVVALVIAKQQIYATNDISVQDAYLEYHRLCIQYPEFANPDYGRISTNPLSLERYYWFVLSMLICIERVLQTYKNTASWDQSIEDDFEIHEEFLRSERFALVLPNFDPSLRGRLSAFIAKRT